VSWPPERTALREAVLTQLGGVPGMLESSVPLAVFVVVNLAAGLRPALVAAVATAALTAAVRLVRRGSVRYAVNGLVGVVFAAAVAGGTGRAENFYLPGILAGFGYATLFAGSVVVRWPLVGVITSFVTGGGHGWREDTGQRRVYARLSLAWAAMYLARGLAQGGLYLAGHVTVLGVVKLAMGLPLFAALLVYSVWRVRRLLAQPG